MFSAKDGAATANKELAQMKKQVDRLAARVREARRVAPLQLAQQSTEMAALKGTLEARLDRLTDVVERLVASAAVAASPPTEAADAATNTDASRPRATVAQALNAHPPVAPLPAASVERRAERPAETEGDEAAVRVEAAELESLDRQLGAAPAVDAPTSGGGEQQFIAEIASLAHKWLKPVAGASGDGGGGDGHRAAEWSLLVRQADVNDSLNADLKQLAIKYLPDNQLTRLLINPDQLKRMTVQTDVSRLFWQPQQTGKLHKFLESIGKAYVESPSAMERTQILSLVAPFTSHAELTEYIPGLTEYYFKKARKHAKRQGARSAMDKTRVRYDAQKVISFTAFITDSTMMLDLPYGTASARRSDGTTEDIPSVVRTLVREHIVDQYDAWLERSRQTDLKMSRSTYLRILHYCPALTKKSLHGLDYYSYAASEAFETLQGVVENEIADYAGPHVFEIAKILLESKQYLKIQYKMHINESSMIPDHCVAFALSDTKQAKFAHTCGHSHTSYCESCNRLKLILKDIETKVLNSESYSDEHHKNRIIYETTKSIEAIQNFKAHILRATQQENEKISILKSLRPNDIFITLDWAMKYIPKSAREDQSSWYGKRGISWHVAVVYYRHSITTTILHSRTFVHVFDQSSQDATYVTAIIRHILTEVKRELSEVQNAYIRSDNAGCYHGSQTISSIHQISESTGISVQRWSFSEPQAGKGPSDRMAATIKRHLRMMVDAGNDVNNAGNFVSLLRLQNGVRGVSAYEAELTVDTIRSHPLRGRRRQRKPISGISKLHSFAFLDGEIRAWQNFDIGDGSIIEQKYWKDQYPLSELEILKSTYETSSTPPISREHWHPMVSANRPESSASESRAESFAKFMCPEPGCVSEFYTYDDLANHVETEEHNFKPERKTLRDYALDTYKQQLDLAVTHRLPQIAEILNTVTNDDYRVQTPQTRGWALKQSKPTVRLTPKQKTFLTTKFNDGARTRHKPDPKQVAIEMREGRTAEGEPLFLPTEFLNAQQITSFFGRLSAEQRSATVDQSADAVEEQVDADIAETEIDAASYHEHGTTMDESDDFVLARLLDSDCFVKKPDPNE